MGKFINKYFDKNLDIQIQAFNLMAFSGITAGIVVAFFSVITDAGAASIIITLAISALGFIILQYAEKEKRYHLCGWITVCFVFIGAFPFLFFTSGGYKSGMPYFFVYAVIFTAIILRRYERVIAVMLEVTIYITCCLVSFYYPEMVTPFPSEAGYVSDVIIGIVVSSAMLLLITLLHIRFYANRQMQMQEIVRELEARGEALERYDRMKSDFLASVAHEINTPLAVISACSNDTLDLLEEPEIDVKDIMENQHLILKRIKLIDNVILDLMDSVAIENGRISLNRRPVDLAGFLQNVCSAQFKHFDVNNNRIIYDLERGLPEIWLDSNRIEQVLSNLISNAVYHTKNGVIAIKLERSGGSQIVSMIDNGIGIDAETASAILKRYVSTKSEYWRHGVGLYLCRQIISAHGGEISIESEEGYGTTVTFSIREEQDYA